MKVLVVSTSRKTRGGITAVLKLYEQSEMWSEFHCEWIETHRDGNNARKIWYYVRACFKYVLLLPFYDIVHFHISLPTTVTRKCPLFKLARVFGKKTIIHLHCGSQIDTIWNEKYQYMFERCDCGIMLSESLKTKIEEHVGKSEKFKVVYNPCPIVTKISHYKKQNYILFSGTIYEGKGYKDLIKAFALIASEYPDWRIVLAGNGEVEQARELALQLGITEQVDLLGWVNGEVKHKVFCEAKALCLPSYAEGFPMAVLDAWAYGLPVITTPVGGIPDIAIDGRNLLLFEPGDVNSLSVCLSKMISDISLRQRLSKESQLLAKTKFNLDTICSQLESIYSSI